MEAQLTVYKASAGSGKTFAITVEYVTLLLQEGPLAYRHILAVTFTNKATAEMKLRILQSLWELTVMTDCGDPQQHTAFQQTVLERLPRLTAGEIRQRAQMALQAILHGFDYFHIETIDSFFQTLLSNLARELNLSSSFKVDINDKQVIDQAVDRLFDSLTPQSPALAWIISYIQQRIDDNKRWDVRREVKRLSHHLNNEHYLLHEDKLRDVLDSESRLHAYVEKLKDLEDKAVDYLHNAAEQLDDLIAQTGAGYEQFSRGSSLATYVRNMLNSTTAPPSKTVENYMKAPENWLRAADRKKPDKVRLAEELRGLLNVVEDLRIKGESVINNCRLSRSNINPLRLFNEVNHNIDQITKESNSFLLARTPLLFSRIVRGDDASFVFEKSGTTLRHIMIDEFQDTSALQWNNFKNLLIENMAQGNSCLLVGDVKQGIYRFRNGDWNILQNIGQAFRHHTPAIRHLDVNYRSAENIVRFNNQLFAQAAAVMDKITGGTDIADIYADVRQQCCGKPGGQVFVEVRLADDAKRKADAADDAPEAPDEVCREELLAQTICRLRDEQGTAYKDMAILVRYNFSTNKLLDYFAEHHPEIPLVSDEVFLLSSSTAIQMIVHAFRYLADERDTIALAYLAKHYAQDILHKELPLGSIIPAARQFLPDSFLQHRDSLARLPLFELCEYLVRTFRLEVLADDAPYIFFFQDQLLDYLNKETSDLTAFLQYWEETLQKASIPGGDVEGIRILTIHKSKGLAFHTVLLPYCDWDIERDRRDDTLWCAPGEAPYDEMPLLPIPIYSSKMVSRSIYAEDYAKEHLQRRIENLNLMYVAFTRARQNLFVWADAKAAGDSLSTLGDVLRDCLPLLGDGGQGELHQEEGLIRYTLCPPSATCPVSPAPATRADVPENPLEFRPEPLPLQFHSYSQSATFRQSSGATEFLRDESDNAESDRQAEYLSRGKLLHYVFSNIRTAADTRHVVRSLLAVGILPDEAAAESLCRLIDKRLAHPSAAPWFDGSWQLYNERAILFHGADDKPESRRPDRVMVKDGHAVVVDFKFGTARAAYRDQVTTYCNLLEAMGFSHVEGYLWYVYTGGIEPVYPL